VAKGVGWIVRLRQCLVLQGSFSFDLLLLYCNFFGATGLVFLLELMMYASVRVEGKFLELIGGEGGAFPFRVMESSRKRRAFIKLSSQEYRWLAVEMVRFCSSKGEPIWVRTLKGANQCLLLQLRQNARGRPVQDFNFPGRIEGRWLVCSNQITERVSDFWEE